MSCKLISMDTSSTSTGVAVFIDGVLSRHFLIDTKDIGYAEKRIEEMINRLYKVIDSEKPDIIPIIKILPNIKRKSPSL